MNRPVRHTILGLCLAGSLALPAGSVSGQIRRPSPPDSTAIRTGSAVAWPEFLAGRRTASGETYRPDAWLVAHPTLPLGTRLLLSDREGERQAVVVVADHALLVETGSMLVSGAVASWLGLRDDAPLAVRYRRLSRDEQAEPGPWEPAAAGSDRPEAGPARWSVQLGSFSDRAAAERVARLLDGARVDPVRTGRRTVYRVYFGRFGDRGEAEAWRDRLAGWGLEGFVKHLDG